MDQLRKSGHFRDDLYYRLCSDVIQMPSLRQRLAEDPNELRLIFEALVTRIVGPDAGGFSAIIRQRLPADYTWPGNVRELEQAIRRICLTGRYLPASDGLGKDNAAYLNKIRLGELNAQELLAGYCQDLHAKHGTYQKVAQITGLDRRTVRKYLCY